MRTLTAAPAAPASPPAVALRALSDERLARWAAKGSQPAFAVIFERHHQALNRYCHSIVGNSHDAADALQNTMLKALRALPGEQRLIALRPWLYRIAHNESISLLRARRTDSDLDAAMHLSDAAAAHVVETRERVRSLTEDLGELTERQRGALLMRELGGLAFTEVADALGTSATAAKQSVYEARCALQAMQEGRAMNCESVQRTISDGDRRMLRGIRMRGHLRSCAACHDFEIALRERSAQLAAMIPALPVGAATAMLHGLFGGSGAAGGSGGLGVGVAGAANAAAGISLGAKAVAVVAVSATLAGGAVYGVPELKGASPDRSTPSSGKLVVGDPARALGGAANAAAQRVDAGAASRTPSAGAGATDGTRPGSGRPAAAGKPAGTPMAGSSGAGRPGANPGASSTGAGKPAKPSKPSKPSKPTDTGKPANTPGGRPANPGRPADSPVASPPSPGGQAQAPAVSRPTPPLLQTPHRDVTP